MITQGNWIARIENPGTGIDVIEEKTGFGVVWLGTEHELKECEYPLETAKANARLIAAAPDMLDALQNLENDDNSIPEHAWKLVKDAIAKATAVS